MSKSSNPIDALTATIEEQQRLAGEDDAMVDAELEAQEDVAEESGENIEDIPFPDGIVGDTARWIFERCEKPFAPFATVAALAAWSVLTGRKVRFENQGTVLYGMLVAASSNGKDAPLSLARTILSQVGVSPLHFTGRFSSWNAGVEILMRCWFHPIVLSLVDEAAGYLGVAKGSDYGLLDFLKAVWSRGDGILDPQGRVKKSGSAILTSVHRPAFSMLLSAQPSTLGLAVGTAQLEDGFLPRTLWAVRPRFVEDLSEENLGRSRDLQDSEEGRQIFARAKTVWNWLRGPDADFLDIADLEARPEPGKDSKDGEEVAAGIGDPQREVWSVPVAVDAEPGAREVFRQFVRTTQARIHPAADGAAEPLGLLWGKAAENAKRVALVLATARFAVTAGPYSIRQDEAVWAVRFVEATVRSGIAWARENMADTDFQRRVQRVLTILRMAPKGFMTRRRLIRRLQHSLTRREVDDVLEAVVASGAVEEIALPTKGRTATVYRVFRKGVGSVP